MTNSISITESYSHIVFDACTLINLYSSQCTQGILNSVTEQCVLTDYVAAEEVHTCYNGPLDDLFSTSAQLDISDLVGDGTLAIISLSEEEEEMFLSLAVQMRDEGEAHTGAAAISRNMAMATDDNRARKIMRNVMPTIHLLSTPELIHHWVKVARVSEATVQDVVKSIRIRASFTIPNGHPLTNWWLRYERA